MSLCKLDGIHQPLIAWLAIWVGHAYKVRGLQGRKNIYSSIRERHRKCCTDVASASSMWKMPNHINICQPKLCWLWWNAAWDRCTAFKNDTGQSKMVFSFVCDLEFESTSLQTPLLPFWWGHLDATAMYVKSCMYTHGWMCQAASNEISVSCFCLTLSYSHVLPATAVPARMSCTCLPLVYISPPLLRQIIWVPVCVPITSYRLSRTLILIPLPAVEEREATRLHRVNSSRWM